MNPAWNQGQLSQYRPLCTSASARCWLHRPLCSCRNHTRSCCNPLIWQMWTLGPPERTVLAFQPPITVHQPGPHRENERKQTYRVSRWNACYKRSLNWLLSLWTHSCAPSIPPPLLIKKKRKTAHGSDLYYNQLLDSGQSSLYSLWNYNFSTY